MPIPIAIINNAPAPYRTHLHERIAREIPAIRLWSVFTHQISNAPWEAPLRESIGPVCFGPRERSEAQSHPLRQLSEWRKGGRVIDWMKANRIRAVVLSGYNDMGRLRILRWCERSGVPCFLWGDSNILADAKSGPKAWLKRVVLPGVLRRTSGALHCGRNGHSYFRKYGVPEERLFSFPCEPDYDSIQAVPAATVAEMQSRHKLSHTRRRLLFCGRLAPVKRPDLLVQVFIGIAGQRPEWDLVLAGDGPLRKALADQIPTELKQRVQFTGFINDPSEIAALYRSSDVLVLPSDFEPWGVVVTEAATCLALVCSDRVGAAADLIQEGVNGRLFAAGEAASLTSALLDVTSPERIDAMKRASLGILNQWRRASDPVQGLRLALASAGIPT